MEDASLIERFRTTYEAASHDEHVPQALIPLQNTGVVFRHTFEYTVEDFAAEAGFFLDVFGFQPIALDGEYALFTTPANDVHVSFRRASRDRPASSPDGLRMLFMTADLDAAARHLDGTGLVPDLHQSMGSPVQRVLHVTSPAGLPIDIWEDPSPE